jgi:hypothetical protein
LPNLRASSASSLAEAGIAVAGSNGSARPAPRPCPT